MHDSFREQQTKVYDLCYVTVGNAYLEEASGYLYKSNLVSVQ